MSLLFIKHHITLTAFTLISVAPAAIQIGYAQSQSEPPARTYYVGNRVVKERWFADANGEKHCRYIKYSEGGRVLANYTFTHGIENGPAYFIAEYGGASWHSPHKYVGSFSQGKRVGTWALYADYGNKFAEFPSLKEIHDNEGNLIGEIHYINGKLDYAISFDKRGLRDGLMKVYDGAGASYGGGNYSHGVAVGTWRDVELKDKDGQPKYAKGGSITFENGAAISTTDDHGNTRNFKEEARLREAALAKEKADQLAAAAAAPKVYPRIKIKGIGFTPDSYLLTVEGEQKLAEIAKSINERASSTQKVETIYLSTHTAGFAYNASDTTKKMMYILSLNRAAMVKRRLQEMLDNKSAALVMYACAGALSSADGDQDGFDDDVRVQMRFNEDLPRAKTAYVKLQNAYGLSAGDKIISNNIMRRSILKAVDAYFEDDQLRNMMLDCATGKIKKQEYFYKIPRELWVVDSYAERFGEESPSDFRAKVEAAFRKYNKQYGLLSENNGKGIPPSVLFQRDLESYTKSRGE
jgi:outer membrane protein OmpA-like peptidoglycan-associated protein